MTTYKVTGQLPYLGHPPGEVFEADLEPNMERRALQRGAIAKSKAKPTAETEEEDDA